MDNSKFVIVNLWEVFHTWMLMFNLLPHFTVMASLVNVEP
jgi:hypothetical protein